MEIDGDGGTPRWMEIGPRGKAIGIRVDMAMAMVMDGEGGCGMEKMGKRRCMSRTAGRFFLRGGRGKRG